MLKFVKAVKTNAGISKKLVAIQLENPMISAFEFFYFRFYHINFHHS